MFLDPIPVPMSHDHSYPCVTSVYYIPNVAIAVHDFEPCVIYSLWSFERKLSWWCHSGNHHDHHHHRSDDDVDVDDIAMSMIVLPVSTSNVLVVVVVVMMGWRVISSHSSPRGS